MAHRPPRPSAPTNILANVHVVYNMYLPEASYTDHALNTANYTRWRDVDAVLSGGRFGKLERVCLEFVLENQMGAVADMFLEAVKVDSPALRV
ncbi:hypothetical protein H0H81_012771, partial [Sphagnurus paluster]